MLQIYTIYLWLPLPFFNPRQWRGVDATPHEIFLSWTLNRLEYRAEIFHSLWGIFCATFSEKVGQVRSGHEVVTS